jgi:WD40 repeat protein
VVIIASDTGENRHPDFATIGPLNAAVFTPDGKQIVTVAGSREVRVWDRTNGRHERHLSLGSGVFKESFGLTEDGQTVISRNEVDKLLVFHDLLTGKEKSRVSLDLPGKFPGLYCTDTNAHLIAAGSFIGDTVHIIDSVSGKQLSKLHASDLTVRTARFIDEGKKLIVTDNDHCAQVWDVASAKRLLRFEMGDRAAIAARPDADDGIWRRSLLISRPTENGLPTRRSAAFPAASAAT